MDSGAPHPCSSSTTTKVGARFAYLVNPAARGGRAHADWHRLLLRLEREGLLGIVHVSAQPGELSRRAQALASQHDFLVAAGGDGTVMEVATGLANSGSMTSALGILPLGSGNDAARGVGLTTLEKAISALRNPRCVAFDGIDIECAHEGHRVHRRALVLCGTGLAADLIVATPTRVKRLLGGRAAYVIAFFRALLGWRPTVVEVTADSEPHHGRLLAVVAANHTHAGGGTMHIGPGASARDGRLDLSILHAVPKWQVVGQFLALLRGTHILHPAVRYARASDISVVSDPPMGVQADGDWIGTTPARFRVRPGAVRVLVPSDYPAAAPGENPPRPET